MTFGGKVTGRSFGVDKTKPPRINLLRLEEELSAVHLRLSTVVIENLPYQDFIKRYDCKDTFFFCDPPYHKLPYYKHNMVLKDYEAMSESLSKIQGKFILSINDHPEMRKAFNNFNIKQVSLLYTVGGQGKQKQGKELLITNY